jgi:hypothetical protein
MAAAFKGTPVKVFTGCEGSLRILCSKLYVAAIRNVFVLGATCRKMWRFSEPP